MCFILLVAEKIKAMKCKELGEMLLQKLDDDAYKLDVGKLTGIIIFFVCIVATRLTFGFGDFPLVVYRT